MSAFRQMSGKADHMNRSSGWIKSGLTADYFVLDNLSRRACHRSDERPAAWETKLASIV